MEEQNIKTAREKILIISLISLSLLTLSVLVAAIPTGPSGINITANETGSTTDPLMVNISGGNISKLNVTASTQNPHWKAFVGWIDGRFTLDDSSGSTIYDWTLSTVGGEVYATRNSSTADWNSISCADATEITAEDTALEHSGEDNITSTFTAASNSKTFVVAGTTIAASSCSAINTHVSDTAQSTYFEEVILHDTTNVIFATVLEEDETGFDGVAYDFQMIVPENANETKSITTAYYLYVELS